MSLNIKKIRYLYIRIVLALLVLAAGSFFVLTDHNFDTDYNKAGTFTDIKVLQMQNGDVIEQELRFDHTTVHSIGISVINRTNACEGRIKLSLLDYNGNEVWTETTNASDFKLQKVKWYRVKSEVDVEQPYVLYISAVELDGLIQFAGLATEDSAEGADNMVLFNNQQQEELSLFVEMAYSRRLDKISRVIIFAWTIVLICHICAFEVLYADKKRAIITAFLMVILAVICAYMRLKINFENRFNYKIFAGVIFLIALAIILAIVMLLKGCKKVELYFILYATLFGILYSILLPPFSAPDEDRHFIAAYRLSNVIMLQSENDRRGITYMRECDTIDRETYVTNEYFENTLFALLNGREYIEKDLVKTNISFEPSVPITMYLPQVIGLTIGRILRLNHVRLVYCGRLTNFLFFMLITLVSINIIPYGKWVIFAICQIPIVMELATSYSYDSTVIALTFLVVAYILKMFEQKAQISKKQLIILIAISVLYAPLKPVYLPIIALVFIIPNKKIADKLWKSMLYKIGIILLSVIVIGMVYECSMFNMMSVSNKTAEKSSSYKQPDKLKVDPNKEILIIDKDHYERPNLRFMIENPFDLVESYSGAALNLLDEFLLSAVGKYLAWYDIVLPTYVGITVMVLMYLSFACEDNNTISSMNYIRCAWTIIMLLGCWFAILLPFYLNMTDPSKKTILGVQGRYFIPTFPIMVFLFNGKHIKKENVECNVVMLASLVNVMTLMCICSEVWSR